MKKIFFTILSLFILNTANATINMDYNDGIYHFILYGDKVKKEIQFVSSANLITNKEAHNNAQSLFTINTGFFDPKNQKTISYIVNEYQTIEDPIFNENLLMNPVLRKNLKNLKII